MPDVASGELLRINDDYHFLFGNITKTWHTHALKKLYDSLKIICKFPIKADQKKVCAVHEWNDLVCDKPNHTSLVCL